ncbi:mitogen-activated protein kinase-binding protein 1-like [Betta splendens]|uniref:Mitogen-activated protein kinase-binding protein 1-like n=1 Tax=Betta splendens TaxID=158456 RepID=A0A6P7LPC1_BETSP|nr:mitogen-activated protein kinase-binding protein 1-like [Betta splendens]
MPADGFTIKSRIRNLLRSPSVRHKKNSSTSKVTLEKVLGITASGNSGLACDPRSGLVAYPAGCVVVLLNPKKNRQHHIINTSRKTITALSFSPDGKFLVTGESGHLPAVRLWDVAERKQVAELQKHKYGVSCVAFSPNGKYVVSVGNQHDMMVNVWAWKKDVVVAANKVSSKVTGVSFSEDSSYFVTVGNRHVRFWYLDHCKSNKASAPVPLLGRSGLLGELRNNFFCDVACGVGSKSDSTFCVTSSGLLCEFDGKRMLDKWVDLQTTTAQSLALSEDAIFCACADGAVRAFSPADLSFVGTLPRPHRLGRDASDSEPFSKTEPRHPDAIAVTYDPAAHWLSCVYHDHSLYVWDVRDVRRVGRVHSALFHAACVWDLEVFPDAPADTEAGPSPGPSPGAFVSCSADSTVRVWHAEEQNPGSAHSRDLLDIIHIDKNTGSSLDQEGKSAGSDGQTAETRTGIRTVCISPDGKHLASGDRSGILRIHDLGTMKEILRVEAHDAEILCLEYSKPETGLKLLATASRDRLIHVLDAADGYGAVQTLDDHSSSITAVRFAANDNKVRMISCGADKSVYFRTAHKTDSGAEFRRSHHVARKCTLYDMGVDPTCKYAAVGCQDRCVRIFDIGSGEQKKLYKGSLSEDGSLLRVQVDPSGQYVATSCSDKNISMVDFYTGECVATVFGHSEVVTAMKFTNDCRRLISASGDSCVFVWRLAPELTLGMRERLCHLRRSPGTPLCETFCLRQEPCGASTLPGLSSDSDRELEEEEEEEGAENNDASDRGDTGSGPTSSDGSHDEDDTGGSDEGQDWEMTKNGAVAQVTPNAAKRPRRRWSHRMCSLELVVKSLLDVRQPESFGQKEKPRRLPRLSTGSLQEQQAEGGAEKRWAWAHSLPPRSHQGPEGAAPCPEADKEDSGLRDGDCAGKEQACRRHGRAIRSERESPDSACSLGYGSREASPDHVLDDSADVESLSPDSSDEEEEGTDDEEEHKAEVTSMDEALRTVTDTGDCSQEDFLKQNFETLAESGSMAEQSRLPRLSMSSRFLARGHNNREVTPFARVLGRGHGAHFAKPPVSKVRPLMEDDHSRNADGATASPRKTEALKLMRVLHVSRADAPESDSTPTHRPQRTQTSWPNLWRTCSPPSRTSLLLDRETSLQKSHSALNLSSPSPFSPASCSDQRELSNRSQSLFLDCDAPRSAYQSSSLSSGSPQSPQAPLPWGSPKLKPQHSYMNPTASSMAKSSRSSSLGDGIHAGTPPGSPSAPSRRVSSSELEIELASPASTSPPSHGPPTAPHPRAAAVSPVPFAASAPPSRIPLPKQPLSSRRSLCLEVRPSSSWCGGGGGGAAPATEPGCGASGGRQVLSRHLSLSLDTALLSSAQARDKRCSVSESDKERGHVAATKERPLVAEQPRASNADPRPDPSITLETCRQAVAELHSSLRKTVMLYTTVLQSDRQPSRDQEQMRGILSEALFEIRTDLERLPPATAQHGGPPVALRDEGDKALALLEQYAELLLKSVERRLDTKS